MSITTAFHAYPPLAGSLACDEGAGEEQQGEVCRLTQPERFSSRAYILLF